MSSTSSGVQTGCQVGRAAERDPSWCDQNQGKEVPGAQCGQWLGGGCETIVFSRGFGRREQTAIKSVRCKVAKFCKVGEAGDMAQGGFIDANMEEKED